MVIVHIHAGGTAGLGYAYTHAGAAAIVREQLAPLLDDGNPFDIPGHYVRMVNAVRNIGRPGVAASAISAGDVALWDLKSRLLELPLVSALGSAREGIRVYGSGGFTSYSIERLRDQLGGWVAEGIRDVKMKIGRDAGADPERVAQARMAIGPGAGLFVDANGACTRTQALAQAHVFAEQGVVWFEEPVSSDDLEGLRCLRDRAPGGMSIAAGEYGYQPVYFRRLLQAGAVDVLQADATRCGGVTGFLAVDALCDAWNVPLSAHTAPSIHAHACSAAPRACNLEYFHDHVRIEQMLFDGVQRPVDGILRPDRSRPGLGLELKRRDAERFAAHAR
ncbi:MAG TPA: enolase C-terminal domain-like protein [Vicinamibacterales bacterium]